MKNKKKLLHEQWDEVNKNNTTLPQKICKIDESKQEFIDASDSEVEGIIDNVLKERIELFKSLANK